MMERGQKILIAAKAIQEIFTIADWTEIGLMTGADEWIDSHPRLLRSLKWGDDDYRGHVLAALKHIIEKDSENFVKLIKYEPISNWLRNNEPGVYVGLNSEISRMEIPHIMPNTSTDSGLAALADAQVLLRERGPASAVDRVHTGLHAFLKAACTGASIAFPKDPTANQLLKLLFEQHPNLQNLGPNSDQIKRMVKTSASIVDAMGTLRNNASLVHPNDELLGQDEALLTINLARSLMRYLDTKISELQ